MTLDSMFVECAKYVKPEKHLHIFEYYAEQYSRIPRKYHSMPAIQVMTWAERNTIRHFKHKYFKKFEEKKQDEN